MVEVNRVMINTEVKQIVQRIVFISFGSLPKEAPYPNRHSDLQPLKGHSLLTGALV